MKTHIDEFVFDSSMDMIIVTDMQRNIVKFNKAAQKIFGYEEQEVVGKGVDILYVNPHEGESIGEKIAHTDGLAVEVKNKRKNGEIFYSLLSASALLNEHGERIGNMGISRDISEQKRLQRSLHIANEALQGSPDAIFLIDKHGRYVFVNKAMCRMVGFEAEELLNMSVGGVDINFSNDDTTKKTLERIRRKGTLQIETSFYSKKGAQVPIELNITYITFEGNELYCGFARDISRRIETQLALWESNQRFLATFEQAAVGLAHVDLDGKIVGSNQKLSEIVGFERNELLNKKLSDLSHPNDMDTQEDMTNLLLEDKVKTFSLDKRVVCKSGVLVWVTVTVSLVRDSLHKPAYFIVVIDDISAKKRIEEQLNKSFVEAQRQTEYEKLQKMEKEVMLKEIHHRVKNNMQIISSIFNLQLKSAKNEQLQQLLRQTQNRIHSMALVHDLLYKSENLAKINMQTYIKELVKDILNSLQSDTVSINTTVEIEELHFNPDKAITIGIILNELLVNSIKHAFLGMDSGQISVTLTQTTPNEATLTVSDDGIGLDENSDMDGSLGFQLIKIFCQNLACKMVIENHAGVNFRISFGMDDE